jgi:hypothetical protein
MTIFFSFFGWRAPRSRQSTLRLKAASRQPMAVRIDGSQQYARITLDYAGYERGRDSRVLCERICGGCQLYVRVLLKLIFIDLALWHLKINTTCKSSTNKTTSRNVIKSRFSPLKQTNKLKPRLGSRQREHSALSIWSKYPRAVAVFS